MVYLFRAIYCIYKVSTISLTGILKIRFYLRLQVGNMSQIKNNFFYPNAILNELSSADFNKSYSNLTEVQGYCGLNGDGLI